MTAETGSLRRPVLGIAVVAATVVVLHRFGDGPLAAPPLGSSAQLDRWWAARDPVTVGFALFRLGALAVAYHLLVTSVFAAVGTAMHRPGLVRVADRWTLPPFRGALARVVGLSLSTAAALTPPVTGAGASPGAPIGVESVATLRAGSEEIRILQPAPTGTVTLRLTDPRPTDGEATLSEQGPGTDREPPDTEPAPPAEPADATPAAPDATRHRVRPGDHLWALAEESLARTLGRPPSDAEVAPHWRRVVDANPQLADPDLLFPGDEVVLPAP